MTGDEMRTSRYPGWHRFERSERVAVLARGLGIDQAELEPVLVSGGLDIAAAETLVEDVCGRYALPFAVAPNFRINGEDQFIPMVIEEPSVVAAAANAARIVRTGGGFNVELDPPVMICQVQLLVSDPAKAALCIDEAKDELLELARRADPALVERGGGPVGLRVRIIEDPERGEDFVVVHLLVDVQDAMGANAVNTMGEAMAPRLEALTSGRSGLRILTNLADQRLARARFECPAEALAMPGFSGEEVLEGVVAAARFAELDPYRAATHNKGIMNGVDAVLLATGNDWRAVEAGAHAYAAREGRYRPLSTFRKGPEGQLAGALEMPMAVGVVGGATRVHGVARLALRLTDVGEKSGPGAGLVGALARAAAAAGLATNLAALRALGSEGIQRGHMRLHARSRHLVPMPTPDDPARSMLGPDVGCCVAQPRQPADGNES